MREDLLNYNPQDHLRFRFSVANQPKQFAKDESFDKEIEVKFHEAYYLTSKGRIDIRKESADGISALIILFDQ